MLNHFAKGSRKHGKGLSQWATLLSCSFCVVIKLFESKAFSVQGIGIYGLVLIHLGLLCKFRECHVFGNLMSPVILPGFWEVSPPQRENPL